jgi:hypothetical protein
MDWVVDSILEVSRQIYPSIQAKKTKTGKTFHSLAWQTME